MTIANQAGASFRSDLNNMAAALVSQSSGVTAPATTYAFQLWADTTSGMLKIRNSSNSGWITIGLLADLGIQTGAQCIATVGGTVDAITLTLSPVPTALFAGPKWWRAAGANATTTPTANTAGLGSKTLVKGNNIALAAGDIPGAGAWMCSQYDATLDKEVLLNPATGVTISNIANGSGRVLKVQSFTNGGGSTTSTSAVNLNSAGWSYTPVSTASRLVLILSGNCYTTALGSAAENSRFYIGENTGSYAAVSSSAVLQNMQYSTTYAQQIYAPLAIQVQLSNASLSERTFACMGSTWNAGVTAGAVNLVLTVIEVAN